MIPEKLMQMLGGDTESKDFAMHIIRSNYPDEIRTSYSQEKEPTRDKKNNWYIVRRTEIGGIEGFVMYERL